MKNYIKILALPITILIIMIIILVTNIPHLEYKYDEIEQGYFITNAVGNAEYYNISDTYKGKPVLGIAEKAFYKHNNLKEINLPSSIKYIDRMAFSECENLSKINLENIEEIERNAFSYCKKLTTVNLNATDIGASAFYKCINLKDINLNNTNTIGTLCFSNTKIETISIPKTCDLFGGDVFFECEKLKTINVYGNKLKDNDYLISLKNVNWIGE